MSESIDENDALIYMENVHKHGLQNDSFFILQQLPLDGNLCIADIGYGTGTLLRMLRDKKPEASLYGVEKSFELYNATKQVMSEKNIFIFNDDFLKWHTVQQFDTVIMSFYLHHTNNFCLHLKKAFSILSNIGTLFIMDRIAIDEQSKAAFPKYWNEHYCNTHEWREDCPSIFSREDLKNAAAEEGFYIKEFLEVPGDLRDNTEGFPKTIAIICPDLREEGLEPSCRRH